MIDSIINGNPSIISKFWKVMKKAISLLVVPKQTKFECFPHKLPTNPCKNIP